MPTDAPLQSADRSGAEPIAQPIRLVAIDLDGTLLRSDKRLSKKVVRAVHEASARGVRVVIASARPPRSTVEIYRHLDLDTPQVNYNGALIVDLHRARYMQHLALCNQIATQIVAEARRMDPGVCVSIELLDKWLTDRHDPNLLTETARSHAPDFVGDLDTCLRTPVTKLMLLAEPPKLAPIREMVRSRFAGQVSLFVTDDHLLQVCHPAVEKAAAVAWVAQHYGIPQAQCMAIGDAPNDAAMLRWAGLGVAVGNAWAQTREAADTIVASNDDDGVAEAIQRYVLRCEQLKR
jgi:Cof subfamily protein (haloacid dehalogenase superfamily)